MATLSSGQVVSRLAQRVAERVERDQFAVIVRGERFTLAASVLRDLAVEMAVPLETVQQALVDAEVAGLVVTFHDEQEPLLVRAQLL